MAQARSTALAAAWAATARTINPLVEVQWDGATWADETSCVESIALRAGIYGPQGLPGLGMGEPGRATLVLNNDGNRYSPDNAASPLHASIRNGIYRVPIRVSLSWATSPPEAALRQFTGSIEVPNEWEDLGGPKVQFVCLDASEPAQQHKYSSALLTDQRPDELLATLLSAAGLTDVALDTGLSTIPWAWFDDENIWGQAQQIAQADGGLIYIDKSGTARYERQTHWLEGTDHTTPQATLNRGNAWWLSDSLSWRDCYTKTIVEYAPRYMAATDDVYYAMDPIEVPPGGTKTETCRLRYPVAAIIPPVAGADFQAVTSGMMAVNSNVTVTIPAATEYAQRVDVRFTNKLTAHAMYILNFRLRGAPVLGDEAQEEEVVSALGIIPGEKAWPLRNNPFIQTKAQANRLAQFLRDRLERPRRLLGWRGPACPWLELGDRVTVVNERAGINTEGYVLGIDQTFRAGAHWEQELTILPAANLFPYASYFKVGSSAWADPSDRVFY